MMPGPGASGSTTTAAPTPRCAIWRAASRNVWPGPIVRTTELIPSLTCIRSLPAQVRIGSSLNHLPDTSSVPTFVGTNQLIPYSYFHVSGDMTMRTGTVARRRTLYEEAVEIIEREYAQPLELDDVARRLATSRRQLQRAFAEIGDTSFRTYVARVRMLRALDLLREGRLPVREVANNVGYRQPAQFAKTFRRHHGAPPSSFRAPGAMPHGGGGTATAV